ncbi:MAG: aminotransferase class V-fold PLP-dependent enzyme [Cyanobacteria bacterium J06621_11]
MFNSSDYFSLLQQLEQFFHDSADRESVSPSPGLAASQEQLSLELPTEGKPLQALEKDISSYLSHAVKTAHPTYFNQLWGGFNAACFMGDVLTSATNTSMYTHEVAPMATLIEKTLIAKVGELIGFSNPEGQFTTGGSNGNLMALAIARHRAFPNLKQVGLSQSPKLIAFVSAEAHYSFDKAVQLLGIGSDQLWKVPTDAEGKMDVAMLEKLIQQAKSEGSQPFFVAGTAGTTVRGAYDPLNKIGAIAQQENLWFHVDGAWGASVLLSPAHRTLMQGVEQADSVVWDAHKMMGMTLICSMLVVKQRGAMMSTFSAQGTDYIFHDDTEAQQDPTDLGPSTLHCGRRVDAVKLWLAWQHLGDRGWQGLIDRFFTLAAQAESIISAHESLSLVAARASVNLCFQYIPQHKHHDTNELTLKIRQRLIDQGVSMVNYAELNGKVFFRLVICNNQTRLEDLERFFEDLIAIAHELDTPLPTPLTAASR